LRRHLFRRTLRKFIKWTLKDDTKEKQDKSVIGEIGDQIAKNIIVGQFVNFGEKVILYGIEPIKIGNHTMIGSGTIILSSLHNFKYAPFGRKRVDKPVIIGNEVIIGAGSIINPGINIGNFSIIKPGSVVSIDTPESAIVEGNPAKIMSIRDDLSKLKELDLDIPTIKIVDTAFAHNEYTSGKHSCPYFRWDRSPVSLDDSVVIYTNHSVKKVDKKIKRKIAWLLEPYERKPELYKWVIRNNKKFDLILTHDRDLLDLNRNFEFVPFGSTWIRTEDQKIHKKSKLLTIIASFKKETFGHMLRHSTIEKFGKKMDVYGSGYKWVDDKIEALKDYMFQIVIENSKKDYWFTEKLIDCFLAGTIPIYWGCPSIEKYFDVNGMIQFDTIEELEEILKKIDQKMYQKMLPSIKRNFEKAKEYILAENWLYKYKKDILFD